MLNLVVTKTPLRISFLGGGTDINYFYKNHEGNIFSAAINKFIYITVKRHANFFKENYRLNYSNTEIVKTRGKIKNNIIRECLKFTKTKKPLYISTVGDVPSGSGLGGSSSFTVGLLTALYTLDGKRIEKKKIYNLACKIEINILKQNIGKQDQLPATFGGVNFFKIKKNGKIEIKKNNINFYKILRNKIKIYWTGTSRNATRILDLQKIDYLKNNSKMIEINNISKSFFDQFYSKKKFNLKKLGEFINLSWNVKKIISKKVDINISNALINFTLKNKAYGAKVSGAGGGGFVLVLAEPKVFRKIDKKFKNVLSSKINVYPQGCTVIYKSN
jgi:D-glycero-alpha-D-manno-heptose-7-phosphate kinase